MIEIEIQRELDLIEALVSVYPQGISAAVIEKVCANAQARKSTEELFSGV